MHIPCFQLWLSGPQLLGFVSVLVLFKHGIITTCWLHSFKHRWLLFKFSLKHHLCLWNKLCACVTSCSRCVRGSTGRNWSLRLFHWWILKPGGFKKACAHCCKWSSWYISLSILCYVLCYLTANCAAWFISDNAQSVKDRIIIPIRWHDVCTVIHWFSLPWLHSKGKIRLFIWEDQLLQCPKLAFVTSFVIIIIKLILCLRDSNGDNAFITGTPESGSFNLHLCHVSTIVLL